MSIRERILAAAACAYAKHGFKGTTTRMIASEAGVNEVTIFRTFGTKAALIAEAVQGKAVREIPSLPELPVDPQRELTAWCDAHLKALRDVAPFIRMAMAEFDEASDQQKCMTEGHTFARNELVAYVERLRDHGKAASDCDCDAAAAMLLGAVFSDAMSRTVMPGVFPQPAESAAERYTRCFLGTISPLHEIS